MSSFFLPFIFDTYILASTLIYIKSPTYFLRMSKNADIIGIIEIHKKYECKILLIYTFKNAIFFFFYKKTKKFAGDFMNNNEFPFPNPNINIFKDQTTPDNKEKKNISWFAVTDNFLKDIQESSDSKPELAGTDFKILFYMLREMDYNNICELPDQEKLSKKLHISKRSISSALTHLKKRQYITRDNRQARNYMLNPYYFYRGGLGPQKNKKRQFTRFVNKNEQEKIKRAIRSKRSSNRKTNSINRSSPKIKCS